MNYKITFLLVCTAALSPVLPASLGVADITIHDSGIDRQTASDLLQRRLARKTKLELRDRKAMQTLVQELETCQLTGSCDFAGDVRLKSLDILIFSDLKKTGDGKYIFSGRAVSTQTGSVIHSQTFTDSNHEDAINDVADEISDRLNAIIRSGESFDTQGDGRFRLAVHSIRPANNAAQNLNIQTIIDSVLVSAFSKGGKFQIVEQARVKDIIEEKALAMSFTGPDSSKAAEFKKRGVTHYLMGTLSVDGQVRILDYHIYDTRNNRAIDTGIIEWQDDRQLKSKMDEIARSTEKTVFEGTGTIRITSCNVAGVRIAIERPEKGEEMTEVGLCQPDTIMPSVPVGRVKLIFKHDDFDTLEEEVEVKTLETVNLGKITLPPIDLGLFESASMLEGQNRNADAIAKYQAFYKKYPRHKLAAYSMYREGYITQIHLKDYKRGREILENVIGRTTDAEIKSEAIVGMTLGLRAEGRREDATRLFRRLAEQYAGTTAAEFAKDCLKGNCPM